MNNIWLLSIVSLINDMASKMILPVLPLFIKELGGAGLAVGLVSGLGGTVASLLKVFSGYWSDKTGKRKPFVVAGYGFSALAKMLFYTATAWPMVLLFRVLERTGKGLRSAPRDAMLAASAKKRGKAFGIHRAFDSGGAVIGSGIVLAMVIYGIGLREVFFVAGVISIFSIIPALFTKETGEKKKTEMKLKLSFKQLPKKLKLFMAAGTIFALANFSYMFFVLKAQDIITYENKIILPVVLYIVYTFFYTVLAVPSGLLADKIGKDKVVLMGYALMVIVATGFMLLESMAAYVILFVLYGAMYALVESNQRAYVSDLSRQDIRGTALGTFFTLTSLAALPAGLIAGVLYDINTIYAFAYAALMAAVATVLMGVQVKHAQRTRS